MNRIKSLDICKCVAMTFLILAHTLQRTMNDFPGSFIGYFLVILGLPIFFFVSGMSNSNKKELKPLGFLYDLLRKGFCYFWPVVLFLLLRVAFYQQWVDVPSAFNDFWMWPVNGLWFLWTLLWINAFMDIGLLISSLFIKYKKIVVSVTILVFYILFIILRENNAIYTDTYLGYDYLIAYTPMFLIGYLVGDKLFTYVNKWLSISLLSIGLVLVVVITSTTEQLVQNNLLEHLPLLYVGAISALLFYYGLSTLLEKVKFGNVLAKCGRFTLEAYFLHLMLLKAFNGIIVTNSNPGLTTIYTISLFLLCLVNTAIVVITTYYIPFAHFLLFGRSFSTYKFEKNFFERIKKFCYER